MKGHQVSKNTDSRALRESTARRTAGPAFPAPFRTLPAEVRDQPQQKRKYDAEHDASHDREVKGSVFAAMNNVAGKFSQAEREFAGEIKERAQDDEQPAEKEKRAAELAERVHVESVENPVGEVKEIQEVRERKGKRSSAGHPVRPEMNRSRHDSSSAPSS